MLMKDMYVTQELFLSAVVIPNISGNCDKQLTDQPTCGSY